MASQWSELVSYESVLVLLTPASITSLIENVRRMDDEHLEPWPPHLKLLYPFITTPSETYVVKDEY
jgi:hypothetical protein